MRSTLVALVALNLWDALATRWGIATGAYAGEANPLMVEAVRTLTGALAAKAAGLAPIVCVGLLRPDHVAVQWAVGIVTALYGALGIFHILWLTGCLPVVG